MAALFTVDPSPGADQVGPGIEGFLVTFALAVATLVLVRSMVAHLRKVRYSTPPGEPDQKAGPDEPAEPGD